MVGVSLCLYFFAILLNGSQTFAQKTTPSVDTTANTNNESKATVSTSNDPNQTTDSTTFTSPSPTSEATTVTPNDHYTTDVATRKADVTPVITKTVGQAKRELEEQDKRTTRNINDYITERSNNDHFNTVPIARYVPDPVDNVDDIIDGLINRPNWNFRDDREDEKNSTYRRANQEEESDSRRPNPSYLGKLTGGLVIPALKARQRFGDAWSKTSDGFKNIGSGTYDAAAGAYNFVKDSASAVLKG